MTLHSQEVTLPFTDTQVEVFFYYTPGCPAKMYLANGDPGYPEEYAEVELDSILPVIRDCRYGNQHTGENIMPALSEETLDAIETMLLEMDYNEEY